MKAGRKSIEPHLKEALQDRNKSLRDLFSFKTIRMKEKPKKAKKDDKEKVEKGKATGKRAASKQLKEVQEDAQKENLDENGYRDIIRVGVNIETEISIRCINIFCYCQVFCNDCDLLVQKTLLHRGDNPHECDVHCGFDGGQGLLKIGYTITKRTNETDPGRSSYSDVCIFCGIICIQS